MTSLILLLHIAAGFLALAMAGVALATEKGATWHRRAGSTYVIGMFIVSATALWLATVEASAFLLAVGIFSFYLVFTGWRAGTQRDGRPRPLDQFVGATMGLTGIFMLGWGVGRWLGSGSEALAQAGIMMVFGAIGLVLAVSDWRDWRAGPIRGKARIARHLSRMLAGTIATITAAVVVNLTFLPDLVTWIGPTVLLTPLIFWWNSKVLSTGSQRS